MASADILRGFWENVSVDPIDPRACWCWTGGTSRGYGQFSLYRADTRQSSVLRAHRFSFMLATGESADGLDVCHSCDNRLCVRPDHLFQGTRRDNIRDMVNKGRHASQKRTHCAQGHEYTPENTRIRPSKYGTARGCRTCERAAWDRFHQTSKTA